METNDQIIENNNEIMFIDMLETESVNSEMLCNSVGCG